MDSAVAAPRGVLEGHAAVALRRSADTLRRTILRTGSVEGRRLLSYLASGGTLTHEDVIGLVDPLRPVPTTSHEPLDHRWLATLAQVMAVQQLEPCDQEVALGLFEVVARAGGMLELTKVQRQIYLDLLVKLGHHRRASEVLATCGLRPALTARHRADLVNPYLGHHVAHADWLDAVHAMVPPELGPLSVVPGSSTPFDGLWAPSQVRSPDGPLVTVVMSVHQPGEHLLSAVTSVLRQSHRALEVIVVDDASGPAHDAVLDEVEASDPRVRVLRLPVNGGTYRCRNYALTLATGEFVTFHDDDDWAHPDRIARQLAIMQADPRVMATVTRCVRATEQLAFVRVGYPEVVRNTSSLMIRRRPVTAAIGFFDAVRKAADTEYVRRLTAVFGDDALVESPLVMAVVRVGLDSLSSGDFRPGWSHRSRWMYRTLYTRWHDAIRERRAAPQLLDLTGQRRHVPVPQALSTQPRERRFDVILVGDWRAYGGPQKSMMAEIEALLRQGRRVGVAHIEAFRFMTAADRPLCDPVLALVESGAVELVLLDESVDVHTVTVRYPPVLQFAPRTRSAWRAERVAVIANQAPFEYDGSDQRYDPGECTMAARAIFGRTPLWVPQGPVVRDVLAELVPAADLAAQDCPGVVDLAAWPARDDLSPPPMDRLVVGRHSRDAVNKFPTSAEELRAAYGFPAPVRVRMLGAARTVPHLLGGDVPSRWELLPVNTEDVQDFLRGLDVVVYFDNPGAREAFGRVVLEALAAGCLVVLPERYRATFGEAAVYCEAHEVVDTVLHLRADPAAWQEQLRTARRVVAERFSYQAYLAQLAAGWR